MENINALETDYLFIKQSQIPNAGNGLFTAIEIYKDEIIAIYKGEILSAKESIKRELMGENLYFMNLLNGKILDCKNSNCMAKFANDANGQNTADFKNNSKIILNNKNQVCLIAIRKIKKEEEILCNYGKNYWNDKKQ